MGTLARILNLALQTKSRGKSGCSVSIPYVAIGVHDCLIDVNKAKHRLRFLKIPCNTYLCEEPFRNNIIFCFLSLLAEFTDLCPEGKGFIPSGESSYGLLAPNYKGQYWLVLSLIISEVLVADWLEMWASNVNILIQISLGDKNSLWYETLLKIIVWQIVKNVNYTVSVIFWFNLYWVLYTVRVGAETTNLKYSFTYDIQSHLIFVNKCMGSWRREEKFC